MLVIRPVVLDDLEQVLSLAEQAGVGLTTLPKDPDLLRERILTSQQSFEKAVEKPWGEIYLFVMEDLKRGRVVGTSAVVAKVGGFEPFYAYRIETSVHESDVLKVRKEIRFLKLMAEHSGPCEIGSLFLHPDYRKNGNGRLLSLVRFLFMAECPRRFDPQVIAEMRGVIDENGRSPFWDALGKHFFDVDFPTADYLSMVNKKFIADLMPTHPIYIPLLPKEAAEVIGEVHEQSRPAIRILEEEGFRFAEMVDIFDGGAIVSCARDEIRTVRQSRSAIVEDITDEPIESDLFIIGNARQTFRACKGPLELTAAGGVRLSSAVAFGLSVRIGEGVRFSPFRRATTEARAERLGFGRES